MTLGTVLTDILLAVLTGYALVSSYVIAVLACQVRDLSETRTAGRFDIGEIDIDKMNALLFKEPEDE